MEVWVECTVCLGEGEIRKIMNSHKKVEGKLKSFKN